MGEGALKKWTEEEVEYLRDLYPTTPSAKLADDLGCSPEMVYAKASKMGLRKYRGLTLAAKHRTNAKQKAERASPHRFLKHTFTPAEDAIIVAEYKKVPTVEIANKLHVTAAAIRTRAQRLGLSTQRGVNVQRGRVSPTAPQFESVPVPISEKLSSLATYDPIFQRVVTEKRLGLPPGHLIRRWGSHV